jgi:isopenicillin-N N-acyltransferase-like protein
MITDRTVALLRAFGTPHQRGAAHGSQLAGELRAFLDDDLCRLNRLLPQPTTLAELGPMLAAYREQLALGTPQLLAEIDGLADGAALSRDEALLLQLRREITGYQRIPTHGDCTTYARVGDQPGIGTVLAQTVDLNGNLDDVLNVLHTGTGSGRESLVLSFGGLLGYLGLNSDGLAIGINLVLGGRWGPGIPPYLLIRHLLDTTGSVAEALATLPGLNIASSRTLTLLDQQEVACVEILDNQLRVVRGRSSVHTNHFLQPDFAARDELNPFALNSSRQRLDAARQRLATLPEASPGEAHFALLSQPPICVADRGDIRAERTVATVVMYPERGEFHLRPGGLPSTKPLLFTLPVSAG